jgi:hypothetical protein
VRTHTLSLSSTLRQREREDPWASNIGLKGISGV